MFVSIQHHGDQFNVQLSSKKGEDHFLSIKGCRIMSSANGQFVSFPARKTDQGKWWTHVWANDKFQNAIIKAYREQPPEGDKTQAPKAKAKANPAADAEDDDIPF
jgi:DNA-binding cell septation regulator SpoVG